jgi:hypothetical protein
VSVWLERTIVGVASLALAAVLIALVSGYFDGRDTGGSVSGALVAGLHFADQGDGTLAPGSPAPRYDSSPPTSGPHVPEPVRAQVSTMNDDQLLSALAAGDVVIAYGSPRPPVGLLPFARSESGGPFSQALAASGLAVLLDHRPGTVGFPALAWTRMLRESVADLPLLTEFVQEWLGRGAHGAPAHRGR